MSTMPTLQEILDAATIDPQVGAVRPDYRALLVALDPVSDAELEAAGDELVAEVRRLGPDVQVARRLVRAG